MAKLLLIVFFLFLLKQCNASFRDAEVLQIPDNTLEKGKPIQLKKNSTKLQIRELSGTIYSDSFSLLNVLQFQIVATNVTKVEDAALCSSPTVKTLEVNFYSQKNIPAVTKNLFQNCDQIEELALIFDRQNGPHQMDQNALEGLSNLKRLRIRDYNITHLKKDFLKISKSLTELSLTYCNIHEIDSDALEDLKNLRVLSISHNGRLKRLPKGLFKNIPKLQTLNLRSNAFQGLTWDEFKDLTNLEVLNIGENQISSFDADKIASNLPNLKNLSIDLNPPPCKEKEAFVNVLETKLKKLVNVEYKFDPGYYDSCEEV